MTDYKALKLDVQLKHIICKVIENSVLEAFAHTLLYKICVALKNALDWVIMQKTVKQVYSCMLKEILTCVQQKQISG